MNFSKYVMQLIRCYGGLRLWKLLAGGTGEKAGFVSTKGTEK